MEYIQNNWGIIATILLGVSELLALIPAIKSNSILTLIVNTVQGLLGKKA
jgi:hypothetical protein